MKDSDRETEMIVGCRYRQNLDGVFTHNIES